MRGIVGNLEDGVEVIDRYGRPWVQRHRTSVLAVAVASLIGLGVAAAVISRRRRRRTLIARLHDARSSMGDRLEGPMSSIRSAAERIAR